MSARWKAALEGLVLTLGVAAPMLVLEEHWHGRPMIDQPGQLWVIPTLVVAAAFALGGAVAGRRSAPSWRALLSGLSVGTLAAGALLVAAVVRRALDHQAMSVAVVRLWVEAALLSMVIAALGGAMAFLRAARAR